MKRRQILDLEKLMVQLGRHLTEKEKKLLSFADFALAEEEAEQQTNDEKDHTDRAA